MNALKIIVAIFLLALSLAGVDARAVLTIEICGSASYNCKNSPALGDKADETYFCDGTFTAGGAVNGSACSPNAPVHVKINPKSPLPTPSGWAAPVAPAITPTPPSNATPDGVSGAAVAAANYVTFCDANPVGTLFQDSATPSAQKIVYTNASGPPAGYVFSQTCNGGKAIGNKNRCLAGYNFQNTGPNCALVNAAIVPKPADGKCTIIRTGNTFAADSLDPDCAVGTLPSGVTVSSSEVKWSAGTSPGNNGKATINGDGTITHTNTTPNATGGTSTVVTVKGSAPDAGTGVVSITGVGQSTVAGQGDQAGGTPIQELPTDYNREATQQAIKASIDAIKDKQCGGVGQVKCDVKVDETGTPTDASLQTHVDAFNTAADDHKSLLESPNASNKVTDLGILWTINWPAADCENPSFSIAGKTMTVDICGKAADIKSIMGFVVAVLTAFAIFGIGVGALKGT